MENDIKIFSQIPDKFFSKVDFSNSKDILDLNFFDN
jgi:hypothetical protein